MADPRTEGVTFVPDGNLEPAMRIEAGARSARPAYEAPNAVAAAVWQACIEELEAPKPGNVGFASAGHGMTADDFVASARCTADVLGAPGLSLGERVLAAVRATRRAAGCNTNLGIVLLCAPLAQAALEDEPRPPPLRTDADDRSGRDAGIAVLGARASRPQRTGASARSSRDAGIAILGAEASRPPWSFPRSSRRHSRASGNPYIPGAGASRPQRTGGPGPGSTEEHRKTRDAGAGKREGDPENDAGFRTPAPAPSPHAPAERLRNRLARVLAAADVEDTGRVFAAIRLAGPAGLGGSARHDVRAPATAPLLEVMREAEDRDRVARQYARCFEDVFDLGLPALAESRSRWPRELAVAALYLTFLARFKDSHIERKLGAVTAETVRLEALELSGSLDPSKPFAESFGDLADFDRGLKSRGVNPGTSADLTVATLLADNLLMGGIASCPGGSGA